MAEVFLLRRHEGGYDGLAMERLIPALAAVVCGAAAITWARAALGRRRVATRLSAEQIDPDLWRLANNDYRRDFQSMVFTAIAAIVR